VRLHDNSIAEALYNNKYESLETPTRTGTVSVNCSVYCRSNNDRTWSLQISEKYQQWRSLGVGQLLTDCSMRIFSHL